MKFQVIKQTNVYQEPDANSPVVSEYQYEVGSYLYLINQDKTNSYYYVSTQDNKRGWISENDVKPINLAVGKYTDDEIIKTVTNFINNQWLQEIIEKLKKDGFTINEEILGDDIELAYRKVANFEDVVIRDKKLDINGWKYIFDVLEKDRDDLYIYMLYVFKNPKIYVKKHTQWYLDNAAKPQYYYWFLNLLVEFTVLRYFSDIFDDFMRRSVDYRMAKKCATVDRAHYKAAFGIID
jgi:hypothetical protein